MRRSVTPRPDEDKPFMLTLDKGAPLASPGEMRAAEGKAIAGSVPALVLMERAAAAAALAIRRFCPGRTVLVLCGPGNNGGDGYGVALALRAAGTAVRVAAQAPPRSEPAATMAARWGGPTEALADVAAAPIIVDALFGTGFARALPPEAQATLDRLAESGATVVALDIASGLDALTGEPHGRPLPADLTIALGAAKLGHVLGQGRALSGRLAVADIGVPIETATHLVAPPRLAVFPDDIHKYRRGHALVIEGNETHGGAARLTALAALRTGAGLVTLVGRGQQTPADAIMRRGDADRHALLVDPRTTAIAIGPGLADDPRARDWLRAILTATTPVVADAGALAILASLPNPFVGVTAPLVLTPHDGEFAALFGPLAPDRLTAAKAAATASNAIIVLKGPATIIAAPDGRAAINIHATAWLATAGSGDVLTGIIAGLLAQKMLPFEAACAAVWLHGDAGRRGGPGLIADDLPALLPRVFAGL